MQNILYFRYPYVISCTQLTHLYFYFRYIAPDSQFDIVSSLQCKENDNESNVISPTISYNLTRQHVNEIISGICPQNELLSNHKMQDNYEHCTPRNCKSTLNPDECKPTYFDSAVLHVANLLKRGYYDEFLQSSFYAKYQVSLFKSVSS